MLLELMVFLKRYLPENLLPMKTIAAGIVKMVLGPYGDARIVQLEVLCADRAFGHITETIPFIESRSGTDNIFARQNYGKSEYIFSFGIIPGFHFVQI
jgi:hypothetical protein